MLFVQLMPLHPNELVGALSAQIPTEGALGVRGEAWRALGRLGEGALLCGYLGSKST